MSIYTSGTKCKMSGIRRIICKSNKVIIRNMYQKAKGQTSSKIVILCYTMSGLISGLFSIAGLCPSVASPIRGS